MQPIQLPQWLDAVARILTAEEAEKIRQLEAAYRAERSHSLALILIESMDEMVGFRADQREALVPVIEAAMEGLPDGYFLMSRVGYSSVNPGQLLTQTESIRGEKILPLLTQGQARRWEAVTPLMISRNYYRPARPQLDDVDLPDPEAMNAAEADRLLAIYMHRLARESKAVRLMMMEAHVERVAGVAQLPEASMAALHTAAKGAAEQLARGTIANTNNWVRNQYQNVKPSEIVARLQRQSAPYFSEKPVTQLPRLWNVTLRRVLTDAQLQAYEAELAGAEAWEVQAQAEAVITEIEKCLPLEEEKRQLLLEKIQSMIRKYAEDFDQMFSFGWYLHGYYSGIPLAMLPKEELDAFLDPAEVRILLEQCLGEAAQYAENIRKSHEERIKKQEDGGSAAEKNEPKTNT